MAGSGVMVIEHMEQCSMKPCTMDKFLKKIPYDMFSQVLIYVSMAGNTLFKSGSGVLVDIVFLSNS